jgi:hypothetical protein
MNPALAEDSPPGARLISPRQGTTLAKSARRAFHALPNDLLREASRRLEITSLLLGLLWLAGAALRHIVLALQMTSPC